MPLILGIESSCDDTAAAVTQDDRLLSNVIASQHIHNGFGGVVPELASRAHQQLIVPVVSQALREAGVSFDDIDAVAVTNGPGLAGSLLVGLSFAKALAMARELPFIGVNHMEGHIYSVFIEDPKPVFPYLCLTVSGGHTQLVRVDEGFNHSVMGQTRDDAAGEAFDKVAKLLGLGYPGGPLIDQMARSGDPAYVLFPRAALEGYDFSFSGLKTSVLYYLNRYDEDERRDLLQRHLPDLCASFQAAVVDVLIGAVRRAVHETGIKHVAIAGGVSANSSLRSAASDAAREDGFQVYIPSLTFCMDNAAMIAVTAYFKLSAGLTSPLTLTVSPGLSLE